MVEGSVGSVADDGGDGRGAERFGILVTHTGSVGFGGWAVIAGIPIYEQRDPWWWDSGPQIDSGERVDPIVEVGAEACAEQVGAMDATEVELNQSGTTE